MYDNVRDAANLLRDVLHDDNHVRDMDEDDKFALVDALGVLEGLLPNGN
jgi:hypothetical protein